MKGDNPGFYDAEVTISVRVHDEAELLAAAREKAREDGADPDDIKTASDALIMLLDPGTSPPGTDIQDSVCEIVRRGRLVPEAGADEGDSA